MRRDFRATRPSLPPSSQELGSILNSLTVLTALPALSASRMRTRLSFWYSTSCSPAASAMVVAEAGYAVSGSTWEPRGQLSEKAVAGSSFRKSGAASGMLW